jgi:hypothetical protein
MTRFIYNDIEIVPARTLQVSKEMVFTDDGVDYLWTHVTIRISGIYNPQRTSYTLEDPSSAPVQTSGELPEDTDIAIRHQLSVPRKLLYFSNFSSALVSSPNPGSITDVNNGPKPTVHSITRIDGAKTFHIEYSIETWINECNVSDQSVNPELLSNRYSQSDDYDDLYYCTRTTRGRAYFRTDLLNLKGKLADQFRAYLLPPVPLGFQRMSVSVNVASSGNIVDWSCVDREKPFDLGDTDPRKGGSGVVRIEATNGISSLGTEIASPQSIQQINVRVWGSKRSWNWNLIQAAIIVASTKSPAPADGWLRQASVVESMTERFCECTLIYMLVPKQTVKQGMGTIPIDSFKRTTFLDQGGLNPGFPSGKGTRGWSDLKLMTPELREACEQVVYSVAPDDSGEKNVSVEYAGPKPDVEIKSSDRLPDLQNHVSPSNQNSPYTNYQIKTSYIFKHGRLHLPIAVDPAGNSTKTSTVVNIHAPMSRKLVEWRAQRVGAVPKIPDPNVSNGNLVILESDISPVSWELLPDGNSRAFHVTGRYLYACKEAIGAGDALPIDAPPWINYPYGETQIVASDYQHGIIDPGGQTGGGFGGSGIGGGGGSGGSALGNEA